MVRMKDNGLHKIQIADITVSRTGKYYQKIQLIRSLQIQILRKIYPTKMTIMTLLTKRRSKWVQSRQDVILRGSRLSYNASQQAKYKAALERLVRQMVEQTERQITKLFESETATNFYDVDMTVAMDDNLASQARILTNALSRKFEKLFGRSAPNISERMVKGAAAASKSSLHSSFKKLSGGLSIKTDLITPGLKTILKASVSENVELISSIAEEYLSSVKKSVMRSITTGGGLRTLIPALEKYKGITERKAKNIALDQTRKVYNSINSQRMQQAGVKRFEWVHSGGGQKPRKEHI